MTSPIASTRAATASLSRSFAKRSNGFSRLAGSPHLRGHLLRFDRGPAPAYSSRTGLHLLLTAAFLEVVRVAAVRWLYPGIPLWLLSPLLLGSALLVVPTMTGLRLSRLGFRRWVHWTATEKSYFLQVLIIANVVFPAVLAAPIGDRLAQDGMAWSLWAGFVPYLFFGFYQELVYRGIVQLELVRRWGASAGILIANALYTFGPLHAHYFSSQASLAGPMFAAIFVVGLFFGVLYSRSGNLMMVGIFHALGNAYIAGSLSRVTAAAYGS